MSSKKNPIRWIKRDTGNNTYYVHGMAVSPIVYYHIVNTPISFPIEERPRVPKSWWKKLWLSSVAFLGSCATAPQVEHAYYERCGVAQWEYRYNVERTSQDFLLENSGRRNCLRFSGPDSCLTRMEKLSNVDYRATCSTERKILLKGNE